MVKIGIGLAKLAFFTALVALGIVFVPDEFMERVERGVSSVSDYLQGEASKRFPTVAQDVSLQAQETKGDLDRLYRSFKEKTLPAIGKWISDHQLERQ